VIASATSEVAEANVYPIVPLGKGLNDFWEAPDK
jgi:hypothetical protein